MTDSMRMTELDLLVGSIFTTRPEEDRELFEEERERLSDIQDLLREEGVEVDLLSRPGVEIWEGGIERYVDLYQLRQIAAYLEQGRDVAPILAPEAELETEPDPLLVAIWDGQQTTRFPHLINQQPDRVYYLPVDFPDPIWPEFDQEDAGDELMEEGVSFGSSIALQRELVDLEGRLRQARVPQKSAPYRCFNVLREAVDLSVANDLPLIIW